MGVRGEGGASLLGIEFGVEMGVREFLDSLSFISFESYSIDTLSNE